MSLRVWLPLNGDLHNQGISDSTATLMGTGITWTAGKIGQAATFPNSCASCIHLPGLKLQILSWACWFKCTGEGSASSQRLLSEGRDTGSVGTNIWLSKAGTTLYWSAHKVTGSTAVSLNTWYHVVLVCDGLKVHLYLNGEEKGTGTAYSADSDYAQSNDRFVIGKMAYSYTATGNYFPFCGQVNDVRIYDHALSAAEVKEIAQGLVLHYKLDNSINLTNNNVNTWTNFSIGQYYTTIWEMPITSFVEATGAKNGDQFTFSIDINAISGQKPLKARVQQYKSSSDRPTVLSTEVIAASSSGRSSVTFALNTNYTTLQLLITNHNTSITTTTTEQWKCIKLEWGDKATPWCQTYDNTIVEDSSGYNHNGTIVGSAVPAANTARYGISTHIDGAGVITTASPGADIRTLSCWVKTTKNKSTSQMLVADSGSNMCISFYSGTIIGVFGTTRSTGSKCTLGASYKENDWNHIVVVKTSDDGQRDIYCNGEKLAPAANDYWSATAGFFVGNRSGSGSGNTPFFGYISDVRAYCTQLLDTDIKQLYNISMKVDKNHNIHTYEFCQKDENKLQKTGILSNSNFNEINNLFNLLYDQQLYIEPDGSCWIRIFHHANCDTKLFASNDSFTTSVYKDADRWFNISLCNKVTKWELMVKSMPATGGTETKYRWIQTKNPMTAAYADVAAANVTKVTGNGYASYGWGGLYHLGSSTYLATNNGTSGNWWGAVGTWAHHQGGIPGWTTVITTGYEDVYLRIDNLDQVNLHAKNIKAGMWIANQFIEK